MASASQPEDDCGQNNSEFAEEEVDKVGNVDEVEEDVPVGDADMDADVVYVDEEADEGEGIDADDESKIQNKETAETKDEQEMTKDGNAQEEIAKGDDKEHDDTMLQGDEDEQDDGAKEGEEDEEEEEDAEDEDEDVSTAERNSDPNTIPQVNVAVLAKRKWQVKVYPLKPLDFASGQISRVFKYAKESLLYILSPGKYSRGKGEMYISSWTQAILVVQSLMKLDFQQPEINIEIVRKNDEGLIEEKAYMRFDTKLVQMLCVPGPSRARLGNRSKRERIIGSVFVKNLPDSTSKGMLRVMFPFAPEINYNPEKFKESTARLVLNNRNAVFPCLKAFSRVELGGNVLELHPLEKRKKTTEFDKSPGSKHLRKSESDKHDKDEKGSGSSKDKAEAKDSTEKPGEKPSPKAAGKGPGEKKQTLDKEDSKSDAQKKSSAADDKSEGQNKHPQDIRVRARNKFLQRQKAGLKSFQEKRKSGIFDKRRASSPVRSNREGGRDLSGSRSRSSKFGGDRHNFGNRSISPGGKGGAGRNRFGGKFGRGGRFYSGGGNRGMRAAIAGKAGEVGMNVETTKEMLLLQRQLSAAIKNQVAMLSQTQMAVEQARRTGGGLGVGADSRQGTSSAGMSAGAGSSSGYSRMAHLVAEQGRHRHLDAGSDRHFGNRSRSRERGMDSGLMGGGYRHKRKPAGPDYDDDYDRSDYRKRQMLDEQQRVSRGWADDREADLYGQQPHQGFGDTADLQGDEQGAGYSSYGARAFGAGGLGFGDSYGYRY